MKDKDKRKLAKKYGRALKHELQRQDTDISKLTTEDLENWFIAFMKDIEDVN